MPTYPKNGFVSLEYAREWVQEFVRWYNTIHYHSGINYMTPNDRHNGNGKKFMDKRKKVYEKAKEQHPERWSSDMKLGTSRNGCIEPR
ncbi:integrase core domain-containing protein [Marinisporobacter balticus]|uniref:integrase core domain-containing protein n=1 Tax=Marinisporobacter balticus TaxID=2018667 RepID=UPI00104987B1